MPCVPPKSAEQIPVSPALSLDDALVQAGVYEPVKGERSFEPERMEAIARVKAADPTIPNMRLARELEMARSTVVRYVHRLEKLMREGKLGLEPYSDWWEARDGGKVEEYDPTASLEVTLRLIQGKKKQLEQRMKSNKGVTTQEITQLVDAEKKLLSIPQRAEDVPKDFYDQLDGRVPVPAVVCPRCGGVTPGGEDYYSEARRGRDFSELGAAGDLGGEELKGEQMKEAVDA